MRRLYVSIALLCSLCLTQLCWPAEEPIISEHDFIYYVGGQGVLEKIEPYLDAGKDINAQDKRGQTALHWATINGHTDVVEQLLQEEEIDPNIQNNQGKTALQFAAGNGFKKIVSDLIHAGADAKIADERGQTPLHWAVWKNHLPVVKLLIEDAHPNINAKDNMGVTPLLWADDPEIFNELVQNGADITAKDHAGRGILHRATNPEVIKLALDADRSQNMRDKEGMTPLMHAVTKGNIEAISILLNHDADVNLKDTIKGRSALQWAVRLHKGSIIHEPTGSPEYLRKQQSRLPIKVVIEIIKALAQDQYLNLHSKDIFGHDIYYYIQQPKLFTEEEREALLIILDKIENEQKTRHIESHGW